MSFRRIALKAVLGLAVVAALAPAASSAGQQATTAQHKFHAHVDAYTVLHSCVGVWNDARGACSGVSNNGNNGSANGFHGDIRIRWCANGDSYCSDQFAMLPAGHNVHMPHDYDRWMFICRRADGNDCHNYLVGAVKMPNGPFAVVAGRIDGHTVMPTSTDQSKVEHQGGPLFLYVGYHGKVHLYTGAVLNPWTHINQSYFYGYVFGFRGWLTY
jgi:hypothetical protein